jgi:GNAT superfamily N-acetyltransferase
VTAASDITALDASGIEAAADQLADVLLDCIHGGASVSFMRSLSRQEAVSYFQNVARSVADGHTVLLVAIRKRRVVGTVQLGLDMPPNQPHRADVKKLLVHRSARQTGIGAALMAAIEIEAIRSGRTLLVLDTASGEADRLYSRAGWVRAGVIPDYALLPDGAFCDTTIFWKKLAM